MSLKFFRNIRVATGMLAFSRHMAGHSKWNNIKHIKGAKDAERAVIYNRLCNRMKAVIRERGSADPKTNTELAHVIEQARRHNMPTEKIQQTLKASDVNNKEELKSYLLEVKGPGGSFFLLDILTSNYTKTRQSMAALLKKNSASWAEGVSSRAFDHKGLIKVAPLTVSHTLGQAMDDAVEVGAEDVTNDEDGNYVFVTAPREFYQVLVAINRKGYQTIEADLHYLAHSKVALEETDLEAASKLYQKFNEDPTIVKIHDNIS